MNIPRFVAPTDREYPHGLLDLHDAPGLFVLGALPLEGIAIVGTRTPSEAAAELAFGLASVLGVAIVSGLARGIDAAAHRGALAAGRPTLAYVATGIDRTSPPEHADLARAIVAAGGGIATEQRPGTEASDAALIARDRLQAAHARAVVLITSEVTGGAMHTMRFARELGRPRFVLEPRFAEPDGNALAVEDGAVPLPWDAVRAAAAIAQGLRDGGDQRRLDDR